ncbi:MAG TPA: hypothetical protein VII91_04050 [Bauldia sp.]
MPDKTHREVKEPQISARSLADYMAASEQARRTIVRGCKYQPRARVIQHDEAKLAVGKYIRTGGGVVAPLKAAAQELRNRMADGDFDRDLFDHNADYIDRFAKVAPTFTLPEGERLAPGQSPALLLHGVKVNTELAFRLRRLTKTNKVRTGAGILRYAKGKALSEAVALWQAAFLVGYLRSLLPPHDKVEVELALRLAVDAYSGIAHPAPTDSVRRFNNIEAACASIRERWPNIEPPPGAVL